MPLNTVIFVMLLLIMITLIVLVVLEVNLRREFREWSMVFRHFLLVDNKNLRSLLNDYNQVVYDEHGQAHIGPIVKVGCDG